MLGAAGVSITEMEKSGKNTFCCGAGGGRMWMEETRGTRINAERTRQVLETGADDRRHGVPVLHGRCSATASRRPTGRAPWPRMDISEVLAARIAAVPADRRLPVV